MHGGRHPPALRTTQLSLERPAISSRGQWIAELASSTSEVAYTCTPHSCQVNRCTPTV